MRPWTRLRTWWRRRVDLRCASCIRSLVHIAELDQMGYPAAADLARASYTEHVRREHSPDADPVNVAERLS